ncbi:MAG: hypothetical protein ACHQUA_01605 [Microgenomates group bacterium]
MSQDHLSFSDNLIPQPTFEPVNDRVRSWGPHVFNSNSDYVGYLAKEVLPLCHEENVSRVLDRSIVPTSEVRSIELGLNSLNTMDRYSLEVSIPLGGRWDGYNWIMVGGNKTGRFVSEETLGKLNAETDNARKLGYTETRVLPQGYKVESIKDRVLDDSDVDSLQTILKASFTHYPTSLLEPDKIRQLPFSPVSHPHVVRNEDGLIVSVATGTVTKIEFPDKRTFIDLEIEDAASHPSVRDMGLNRVIRQVLIKSGVNDLGCDVIHTETRSSLDAPNCANSKNGMRPFGILMSNCYIDGQSTVDEKSDILLADWAKVYSCMNVWAITPRMKEYEYYKTN